jgi:excisionase family DNA binding protein
MDTYTTGEAAKMLGITSARVRQMILDGDIKAEKKGRDLLIPKAEIEKAKRRKTKPGPEPQKNSSPI